MTKVLVPYGPDHPDYPNEPKDWNKGPYMCRDGAMYHMRGYGWQHGMHCWNPTADWDRIAYRPHPDALVSGSSTGGVGR